MLCGRIRNNPLRLRDPLASCILFARQSAMPDCRTDTRRLSKGRFAFANIAALFVVITVAACDDGGPVRVGPGGTTARTGSISANHGHEVTITAAELDAGNAVTKDMRGSADHTHTITLTGTEVVDVRSGRRVTTASTMDSSPQFGPHSHTVTFN